MTLAIQIALTATPLSAYFYTLGLFHGGKGPRVVSGPADVGLLMVGVGGLVAFGPLGQAVVGRVVGQGAGWLPWTIWVGLLVLWSLVFAASALRRMSVYNVTPEELDRALRMALDHVDGTFLATLHGFEDSKRQVGITVVPSPRLRAVSLETYGKDPEVLMVELRHGLRLAFDQIPRRTSGFSHAMFGAAALVMVVPVLSFLVVNPRAKDAFRALMQSLRFW